MADTIITRFPPSPTGKLHIGSVRTALFNYLFARHHGGKIILRFEDTDKARSKQEYETDIYEGLSWLKLSFDAVYRQSERTEIYRRYLQKMLDEGTAYISANEIIPDSGEGEGEGEPAGEATALGEETERRKEVIRLKNPNKTVSFEDYKRGTLSVDTTELGDFVIAKSLTEPLYHFAVVVDDFEMGITHILRGEDGLYNTPRQILIQEAIGATRPIYCHLPLVLGTDRSKLSKRHGAVSLSQYREEGFVQAAIINYLAFLGWRPKDDREFFTVEELIKEFDLDGIQKSAAVFDREKLGWFNRQHIKQMPVGELAERAAPFIPERLRNLPQWNKERFVRLLPEFKDRLTSFDDLREMSKAGELDYFFQEPLYAATSLIPKAKNDEEIPGSQIIEYLRHCEIALKELKECTAESVKNSLWEYATEKGRSAVLWPLRVALSGRERSPDPFALAFIFGKEETLVRLTRAIHLLESHLAAV